METQALSEVVALPVTAGAAQTEGDGEEEEEQSEAVINEEDGEPATGIGHGPVATLSQSTLVAYRTGPVLPNLAKAALERLQKRNAGAELEDSPDSDFQPLKRRRLDENADSAEGEENEEGQTCSICFEPWSNSGHHRISSLKCGHLFGLTCIEKWIRGSGGGKCPQCNAPAKKGDIRVIYSKSISVVDTTDRDRALKDLEEEKKLRIGAQKAEAQAVIQYQLARTECDRLKEEIRLLKAQLEEGCDGPGKEMERRERERLSQNGGVMSERNGQYVLQKTIKISDSGSARVMAHDPLQSMIVVSKPSTSSLVSAYGLAKLSTVDLRHSEYVGVHSSVIRDVCFSPCGDGMVLTASMDKTIKLTSMQANAMVQSFQVPVPAWACAWDQDDPNYFCCGLQNGIIHFYDIRNTCSHVTRLVRPEGGACPVTSLSYVPLCRASPLNCAGLLAGSLDGCVFWEKRRDSDTSYSAHSLDTLPAGACVCVSFEPYTRHCLSSFRPSRRCPNSRHTLFQLQSSASELPFSSQLIDQFQGGPTFRLLSRSKLFQRPGAEDKILAAFGDEATKSVHLWDVSKSVRVQQLSMAGSAALDLLPFTQSNQNHLAVLTDTKLYTYTWQWR